MIELRLRPDQENVVKRLVEILKSSAPWVSLQAPTG